MIAPLLIPSQEPRLMRSAAQWCDRLKVDLSLCVLPTDLDLPIFAITEEYPAASHTRRGASRDDTEAGRVQVGPAF